MEHSNLKRQVMVHLNKKISYVGEWQGKGGILARKYRIAHGVVSNRMGKYTAECYNTGSIDIIICKY